MNFETLRYDQFAFKASHNSIDRRGSITEQLSGTGPVIEPLRGIELDLMQAEDAFTWRVQHDPGANGPPLEKVLREIVHWCDRHPRHAPLTVHLDLKNKPLDDADFAKAIDRLLVKTFGRKRLYGPGEVVGREKDLVRGARAGGWAEFGKLRGKLIFCLSGREGASRKAAYAKMDPKERVCFADFAAKTKAVPRKGDRVFANLFLGGDATPADLERWTKHAGFVVRGFNILTRGSWTMGIRAGLNVLSTDAIGNKEYVLSSLGYAPLPEGVRGVPAGIAFDRPNRDHTFENWSRTLTFSPGRFIKPRSEAEIQEIVRQAGPGDLPVRTQGAGHSFSQILTTRGTLLSLDDVQPHFDLDGTKATVPGGIRLRDLIPVLEANDLALRNIGSVTEQSISGAFSTGTHGTGLRLAGMHTQVEALRMIDARGDVRVIDGSDPELLAAARLSMGMLGIITSVTLDCVPYYQLSYDAYLCDFDEVVDDIDRLNRENQHVLLWWLFPILPRHKVVLVTRNRIGQDPGMLADAEVREGVLPESMAKGVVPWSGVELGEALASVHAEPGYRRILSRKGGYEKMLTIPLLPVHHRECEYAIPLTHTKTALVQLQELFEEGDTEMTLPIEVRFAAGDDDLLSATGGRDVCYIGAATLDNAPEVFERFEPMMKELDGRPHWGRHFNVTRKELRAMYGKSHDRFVEIRREMDPDGVFLNTLLRRLFG